jgi:hypothetical protein
MVKAHPGPLWARNKLVLLVLVVCATTSLLGVATTAKASTRRGIPLSSRALHAARAVNAAERALASDTRALQSCLRRHPSHCAALHKVVRRAERRLAHRRRRLSKLARRLGKPRAAVALAQAQSSGGETPAEKSADGKALTGDDALLPVEGPLLPGASGGRLIGTNDGAGWGPGAAKTILAGHITWNRVEIGASSNTLAQSLSDGFHVLGIVGNVDDGTPLSAVDPNTWAASVVSQLQANPGITIAEAGNEMFLKGGQANAVQYGRLYLAAVNAMKAAGIHTPLLFDMFGDYPQGSWSSPTSWSRDSTGGGWLHDAVNNVPGLAAAILANGMGTHPYGANGENSKDEYGTAAVAAEENNAKTILGSTPTFYITEFGYDLGRCGEIDGACSQTEQATKMSAAYKTFLADPHVAGIFAYQTHDDGTGQWGYMNNDNTTRPTYNIIAENATQQGQ